MKKFAITAAVVLLTFFSVSADDWDIFSLSFTENAPVESALTDVYGIKIGVPISGGPAPVYGIEAALIWAGTLDVNGIKCSFIGTDGSSGSGLQLALFNFIHRFSGIQMGLCNYATDSAFQFGLINIIKNSPVPFFPLINFCF